MLGGEHRAAPAAVVGWLRVWSGLWEECGLLSSLKLTADCVPICSLPAQCSSCSQAWGRSPPVWESPELDVCCLVFSFAFVWKPTVTRSLGRGSAVHVRVVSVNANVWKSVSGSPGPSFALIVVWMGNGGHNIFYNITAMICAHKQGF